MAYKMRSVYSKIWEDNWFSAKLNPLDRYLFLYLLTNQSSTLCGIYEIPIKRIASDTGLDSRDLEEVYFPRLKDKMTYYEGWIYIHNWSKYHSEGSPKLQQGIKNDLKAVPRDIMEYFNKRIKGMDTLSPLALALAPALALVEAQAPHTHKFKEPSKEEVLEYCKERGNTVNASKFVDFYASKGWLVGKSRMKDWKASVRTWEEKDTKQLANVLHTSQKGTYARLLTERSKNNSSLKPESVMQ
jgi:hypothetical protein